MLAATTTNTAVVVLVQGLSASMSRQQRRRSDVLYNCCRTLLALNDKVTQKTFVFRIKSQYSSSKKTILTIVYSHLFQITNNISFSIFFLFYYFFLSFFEIHTRTYIDLGFLYSFGVVLLLRRNSFLGHLPKQVRFYSKFNFSVRSSSRLFSSSYLNTQKKNLEHESMLFCGASVDLELKNCLRMTRR